MGPLVWRGDVKPGGTPPRKVKPGGTPPRKSTFGQKSRFRVHKKSKKKVEIEGAGPPWRDSQRNSAPGPGPQVPNGATATHLVTKKCDLGSLGVPGPASTPLGPGPENKGHQGPRDQGPRARDQGPWTRAVGKGFGPRTRGQGQAPRAKDKGPELGARDKEPGPGARDLPCPRPNEPGSWIRGKGQGRNQYVFDQAEKEMVRSRQ